MKLLKSNILIMVAILIGATHLIADNASAAINILDISVTTPQITSEVPASIRITVTNRNEYAVNFDRATIAYVNSDLTFKGPFLITWPTKSLDPGAKVTVTAKITINTNQPSGTLIPLSISLFYKNLSTGDPSNFRGTTIGAAKVL